MISAAVGAGTSMQALNLNVKLAKLTKLTSNCVVTVVVVTVKASNVQTRIPLL